MKVRTGLQVGQWLSDWITQVCQATGIADRAKKYEQVTGQDCGCEKRKAILDSLLPGQTATTHVEQIQI